MIWPLVDAAGMRALDLRTIEARGVPGEVLMESAGRAVVAEVLALLPPGGAVGVACGPGHNGGDGLVIARHLHALGVPVRIWLSKEPTGGDAAAQLARARACGVPEGEPWEADVLVDALFGTGIERAVEGAAAEAIERIREAPQVVAVDLPSGIDTDTGAVHGVAVRADVTVTMQLPKLGLALEPGRSHAGRVVVARIGIDTSGVSPPAVLWSSRAAADALPERPPDGHKGRFGHVLVVAGSEGKTGAAALASRAAVRGGAGLVTLACPAGLNDVLEVKCTEAMTAPVADTPGRALAAEAAEAVLALAEARDVVALGPGVGRDPGTAKLVREVCSRAAKPLVLDADGLNAFEGAPEELRSRPAPTVLTPHPGEAARLLGAPVGSDPLAAARCLAERTGCVVLLKGAPTVVVGRGTPVINATGGPVLASGGTGDVLTGLVAALLAQGLEATRAAALGAWVHGAAGDALARERGPVGLAAEELAEALPEVLGGLAEPASTEPHALALAFPEP